MRKLNLLLIALLLGSGYIFSQEKEQEPAAGGDLANKIQNPIANLISVPFQNNTDFGIGPDNRARNTLNIQPVIPASLHENLNLITRTIIPITSPYFGITDSKFGLSDVSLSLFLPPAKPGRLIYGGGVALGLPSAPEQYLGPDQWTAGPA